MITLAWGECRLCSSESRDSDFKCHCWFNIFHSKILFPIDMKWLKNSRLPWMVILHGIKLAVSGNPHLKTFAGKWTQMSHSCNAHNIWGGTNYKNWNTRILHSSDYFIFPPKASPSLYATSVNWWGLLHCFIMQKINVSSETRNNSPTSEDVKSELGQK